VAIAPGLTSDKARYVNKRAITLRVEEAGQLRSEAGKALLDTASAHSLGIIEAWFYPPDVPVILELCVQ